MDQRIGRGKSLAQCKITTVIQYGSIVYEYLQITIYIICHCIFAAAIGGLFPKLEGRLQYAET